jgi:hypothetical protein
MFFGRKSEDGIVGNYADALKRIKELEEQNEKLKFANDEYQRRLIGEMAAASYAINWDAMNAFSVERIWDNGTQKTIIGYRLEEPMIVTEGDQQKITTKDVVREWYLYCPADKHEQLVQEFKEWMKKKK